jgi:hypothetical protein
VKCPASGPPRVEVFGWIGHAFTKEYADWDWRADVSPAARPLPGDGVRGLVRSPSDAVAAPQDRLPNEFKLAGIGTVEAVNTWLRGSYIAEHNARFAVSPDSTGAWREILCEQEDRTVGQDNAVKWQGKSLLLPPSRLRPHFVKTTVRLHAYHDGQIALFWGPIAWATTMPMAPSSRPRRKPLDTLPCWRF